MELDQLETELNQVYTEKRDYCLSAKQHQQRLLRIQTDENNYAQYIRCCKKLTWLLVNPKDYTNGEWESF